MSVRDFVHGRYVHSRRVRVLSRRLARLLPAGATVLDVGSGDGWLASLIVQERPDVRVQGLDVLVRPKTHVPVAAFDGSRIPYADRSVDVVLLVDVLHHTVDPRVLLAEAARVARQCVLVKDHLCESRFDHWLLRGMDRVGNARHGVVLPFQYWPAARWRQALAELALTPAVWETDLRIYPAWADWLFGRSRQVIMRLEVGGVPACQGN